MRVRQHPIPNKQPRHCNVLTCGLLPDLPLVCGSRSIAEEEVILLLLRGPPYSESFAAKLYVETRMLAQTPAQHDSAGPAGFHHAEEGTIQIEHEDVIIACTLGGAVGMRRST